MPVINFITMNYIPTTKDLLQRFIDSLSKSPHSRSVSAFVDYVLKCYEDGADIDWATIAWHVTRYRLRQLRFAERCIRLAQNKIFNGYMHVTEPLP